VKLLIKSVLPREICHYASPELLITSQYNRVYVKKDGSVLYFCSTKCQNNHKLGRVSRRVQWTTAGRKALGKE